MEKVRKLFYTVRGKGDTIVLIHGFCENAEMWDSFVPVLEAKYQVVSLDLAGFGESIELLEEGISLEDMANQVYVTLENIGLEKYILLGHSLGGYVSLAFAEKYPEKLAGLGLFHSNAFADTEEKKKSRNHVIQFVEKNGVTSFIENFVPPLFYEKHHKTLQKEMDFVKKMTLKTPQKSVIEVTKAMRDRKDQRHTLENLDCPILYIAGKQDTHVSMETYLAQVGLPKKTWVQFLDETAHMGMFERPEDTLKIVLSFLTWIYN